MNRKNLGTRCACAAALGLGLAGAARGQSLVLNDVYHAQTTSYTCAIASMEMQLDIPIVTNFNPFVTNLLATGDGAFVAPGAAPQPGAQAYIYYMVHAKNAGLIANNIAYNNANGQPGLNNFFYNNPYYATVPGFGTDTYSLGFATNVLDNPRTAGLGSDGYAAYNLSSGYYASRTIAAALQTTNIPAVITVNSGMHDITVFGVNTTASPVLNGPYTINGFFVHDPATGYVMNAPGLPKKTPLGIGINTYLRYGYDKPIPGAPALTLPDGTQATLSKLTWFNYFNVSGAQPAATVNQLFQAAPGYKFEVEPQGPELPDTGGSDGSLTSLPAPTPLLPSDLTASGADGDATPDLDADDLNTEPGFENGSWDTADTMLLQDPSDPSVQGDWLIPYDGSGGVNDVTGAIAIDEDTGVIDQATWFDPNDPVTSTSVSEIDTMFAEDLDGELPNDNPVPEPASIALALPAAAFLLGRRRRPLAR